MTDYLSYSFEDNESFTSTYDELPLWSARFGLMLLDQLTYKPNQTILDIGTGTGFPLFEIASRFGESCDCYGIDVWQNAIQHAQKKADNYGLKNVTILNSSADNLPFEDDSVDLIISNLGINNFEHRANVFNECYRILKPNGKLALTTNLEGHWNTFYQITIDTLQTLNEHSVAELFDQDAKRRGTADSTKQLFTDCGLTVTKTVTDSFDMKFTDGSAFLNHHFVKLGWLSSWLQLMEGKDAKHLFEQIETRLNEYAYANNGLTLNVPMLYVEGTKV